MVYLIIKKVLILCQNTTARSQSVPSKVAKVPRHEVLLLYIVYVGNYSSLITKILTLESKIIRKQYEALQTYV